MFLFKIYSRKMIFFVTGELFLYQDSDNSSLIISGVVSSVAPDGLHGFHVHQFGNLSDSCKGAGPHFNPDGVSFIINLRKVGGSNLTHTHNQTWWPKILFLNLKISRNVVTEIFSGILNYFLQNLIELLFWYVPLQRKE